MPLQFNSEIGSDKTIQVTDSEGKIASYKVSSAILAHNSKYFELMFFGYFKESKSEEAVIQIDKPLHIFELYCNYLYDKENVTKALLGNHKVWVDLFELSQSFSDSSVALNFLEVLKNIPRESRTFENFWIPLNKIIECTPQIDLTTTILEEDSRQWLGILMPHGYGIFFNDGLTSHLIYSLTCPIDMRPSSIKETAPVNLKSDEAEKVFYYLLARYLQGSKESKDRTNLLRLCARLHLGATASRFFSVESGVLSRYASHFTSNQYYTYCSSIMTGAFDMDQSRLKNVPWHLQIDIDETNGDKILPKVTSQKDGTCYVNVVFSTKLPIPMCNISSDVRLIMDNKQKFTTGKNTTRDILCKNGEFSLYLLLPVKKDELVDGMVMQLDLIVFIGSAMKASSLKKISFITKSRITILTEITNTEESKKRKFDDQGKQEE